MKWGKPCEQDRRTDSRAAAGGPEERNVAGTKCESPGSGRGASPKAGID
jgi:hypothetical protein